MFTVIRTSIVLAGLAFAALSVAAGASAQTNDVHPNGVQPETTLFIAAEASVTRAPDIAFISAGVQTEALTADAALDQNRAHMNGVFAALKSAGVQDRHIQTSNFNISPRYNYEDNRAPRLTGYNATNTVTAKITDITSLGATIDAIVSAGGNTLNGITFGVEDDAAPRDEARREAIKTALARAELYASEAGYEIARIVSISEGSGGDPSTQFGLFTARSQSDAAPSSVSGGELDFKAAVNVTFELTK